MNRLASNGNSSTPLFAHLRFKDFEVCWAGPHPYRAGYCFGSEDGQILFTDEQGNVMYSGPTKGSDSGEAINGLASWQNWLAISTRAEVNLVAFPTPSESKQLSAIVPAGAHGIVTTASGYFVASLGRLGLMVVKPQLGAYPSVTAISGPAEEAPYIYGVISLKQGTHEVLACAGRAGGVAAMEFRGDEPKYTMSTITFDGLDVVDICALEPGLDSLTAAAIGRDGTVILFRNVLEDKRPMTVKFDTITGTAYRLLCCLGDLYLLTSTGLFVLAMLGERFVNGELVPGITTPVLPIPMQATDAN